MCNVVKFRDLCFKSLNWAITQQKQPKKCSYIKCVGALDHSTATRSFEKFCLGWKHFNDQEKSGSPKTVESESILQAIEVNLVSSTRKISGELDISEFSQVCHFSGLSKSKQNCLIVPHLIKISKLFTHSSI